MAGFWKVDHLTTGCQNVQFLNIFGILIVRFSDPHFINIWIVYFLQSLQ